MSDLPGEARSPEPADRSGRRLLWGMLGGLLLLVLVLGAWFGVQALQVRDDLTAAAAQAERLQDSLREGDAGTARQVLDDLQDSSASARGTTDGPLWAVASWVPVLGDDVSAVRTVSSVLDDVSQEALPPLVAVADTVNPRSFSARNGRIPLEPLHELAAASGPAHRVVAAGNDDVQAIATADLLDRLAGPVAELQEKLGSADRVLGAADIAAGLLPSMLGEKERRDYLVIFQNNAEIRATGGLPGAFAVVSAENGRLSLGRQGAGSAAFSEFPSPVLPLTPGEQALYTERLGTFFVNTNLTPDFPRTGELTREMFEREFGESVDGVLSADPIALSYILEGTGPVTLADGTRLTSENAADLLLNETYLRFADSPALQDAFFADAAARVFEALSSGRGNPQQVLEGLAKAVAEHRLLVWSSDEAEQQVLRPTEVSGALPSDASKSPHVGVYLNDTTGAKMQYYLDYEVTAQSASCSDAGAQTLPMTLTLRSTAPADAAQSLPASVIGPGFGTAPPGSMALLLTTYAPAGGTVEDVRFDGEAVETEMIKHDGRPVMRTFVLLEPGQEVEVSMDVVSGTGQKGDVDVDVTPGAQKKSYSFDVPSSCGE